MGLLVSVVIITFNEEKNIKRCLESIKDLTDDVVIVDSFSKDKTKAICQTYANVNFIERNWEGYASTKNFANKQAKYDYILSLDADEVLSEKLKTSIVGIKKFSGVYSFNRLTNYCGKWIKHGGWYPDRKVRIFPKEVVFWEGDFVHETLRITGDLATTFLSGDLLHYSYHSIEEHYQQVDKYSTLHAKKMHASGKQVGLLKMYVSPVVKFLKSYLLSFGFLDGYYGFIIAKISAKAVKMKYEKLKKLSDS